MRWTSISFLTVLSAAASLLALEPRRCLADEVPQRFFNKHCCDCHNADEANAGVRLDDAHDRDWSDHGTSLFFERVLKAVRSGKMPPADAHQLEDLERAAIAESLHSLLMQRSGVGGTLLRRLSRSEYENTIRAVFDLEFQVPPGFPADNQHHGFDNTADGLVMSAALFEAYFQSAISVADGVFPPPQAPQPSVSTTIPADDLVISYSSGAIIDGAMRLAARTDTMWRSSTWPENFEVRTAGTYRINISASRFAPPSIAWPQFDKPMALQVRARSLNEEDGNPVSEQRLIAEFEVTDDKPRDLECVVELHPAETPIFYFANAPIDGVAGEDGPFADVLRKIFANDPRLLAGWLSVEHQRGLRGGIGWDRVKKIRDSADLDLTSVDMSDEAVDELVKKMSGNAGLYPETVIYQFFEEGPALEIHKVDIEGPLELVKSALQKQHEQFARRFLGERGALSKEEHVRQFMQRFLTSLHRRPASDSDVEQYTAMALDHARQRNQLEDGLHLAVRTALMSPKFLYRGQRPGPLDDFDLATRLSYFLTGGPPDEQLFAAALAGALSDPKALTEQARRILASPQLDHFVSDFTAQWLGTRELAVIMPDFRLVGVFNEEHRDAMLSETELFFAEILRDNMPLEEFIKPDFTYMNQWLAERIYKRDDFQSKGENLVRVSLSPGSRHGGLLGQASIMMATANGVDTQPVVRGVWVLENILGDPPPPPPESVPALTPDTRNATTIRELMEAHRADASCATCHRRIDALGYVLENFDPVGRWRTNYPAFASAGEGLPVDATAELSGGHQFEDVRDLKNYVLDHIDDFSTCLSRKLLTYATGRPVTYAEKQEVQQIVHEVRARGNGFQDLLLALIRSRAFGTK